MRKTLLGMAGAAALVFSVDARAGEPGDATESKGLRDESSRAATAMVHHERARSDEGTAFDAEAMKPWDANTSAGSASGEPSTKESPKRAQRNAAWEDFLRSTWTTP
jgi:hypothetical protein